MTLQYSKEIIKDRYEVKMLYKDDFLQKHSFRSCEVIMHNVTKVTLGDILVFGLLL